MKKLMLFCAALCCGLMSFAQLESVDVEEFTPLFGGVAGQTTYRVYANMVNSNDLVSAVFAIQDCHPLNVSTTTTFFNDIGFGGTTANDNNPLLHAVFPTLEVDSYITIGAVDNTAPGIGTDLFVAFTIPADPISGPMETTGENIVADDGAWFSLATSPLVVPSGADNRVLIGQFTTDGDFSFDINLQCFLGGDQANRVDYVYDADCTDGGATPTGFESEATFLTFPAEVVDVEGCTNAAACNFDPLATLDNGTCVLVGDACDDLDATTINDQVQADCSCAGVQVPGCTDMGACNFDPSATVDDGSCLFTGDACDDGDAGTMMDMIQADCSCAGTPIVMGCTDGTACNFDPAANMDDGSCILVGDACDDGDAATFGDTIQADCSCAGTATVDGCTDMTACNYNPAANNDDGSCVFVGDSCDDGDATTINDEVQADCSCAGVQVPGCTDMGACNYDPAATVDDGSCVFVGDACDDGDAGTMMDMIQADCSCAGTPIVMGCTDATACEYDPAANMDDGSCLTFPGDACDDGDAGTMNDTVQADCSCVGVVIVMGCTDPTSCEYDPAANMDDGSCVSFEGCTDPLAENYDPTAGCDDGNCVFSDLNDVPGLASALPVTMLGTCSTVLGDVDAAIVTAAQATATSTAGLWYSFTAPTAAARIEVASADFDVVVEIQDAANAVLDVEDVVLGNGNEIMNVNGLTAGDSYFVRVAPLTATAGPAFFDICVQMIPDTRCDYGVGPYSLCDIFKADWVNADDYIFNFTSQTDGDEFSYQNGVANTLMFLYSAGIEWGDSYDVEINSVFNLMDGAGSMEAIEVQNDEPCSIIIDAQPVTQLRESDNQENFGAHFLGGYVGAAPYVCGVVEWEWNFVNTDGTQLPINYMSGSPNRFLQLSQVGSLAEGAVYETMVRPVFATGPGSYGPMELLAIVGPAEIVNIESPVVIATDAERLEIEEVSNAVVYPNPSNGELVNINVTGINADVEKVSIDIFDMYGKVVRSEQIASTGANLLVTMEMNDLASGIYVVNITVGNEVRTERMTIEK